MKWETVQQIVRIGAYTIGGYLFGDAVVNGSMFQAFLNGLIPVGAFLWWAIWERNRPAS